MAALLPFLAPELLGDPEREVEKGVKGRVGQALGMLLILSTIVFLLARVTGSPADVLIPADASRQAVEDLEQRLGLDQPLPVQYVRFLGSVVTGDMGVSLRSQRPVVDVVIERLPATIQLSAAGLAMIVVGIPLGVLAALRRGTWLDVLIRAFAAAGQAAPHFWVGTMLALLFGVRMGILPVAGRGETWLAVLMPAIALCLYPLAGVFRVTRNSLLRVLDDEFVLVARAKGLPEWYVIVRHALRNSLIPVASLSSVLVLVYFMTGSVVIEKVFAWPGIGYLAYQSVVSRDYPVLQGVVLFYGLLFVVGSFVVDGVMRLLDPRLRERS